MAEGTFSKFEFDIGDRISKVGGDYTFEGTVIAVFRKLSGVVRVAAEDDRGIVHIFNQRQLIKEA